eukprot:351062-Chlamydomonas_euryale.AAC.4
MGGWKAPKLSAPLRARLFIPMRCHCDWRQLFGQNNPSPPPAQTYPPFSTQSLIPLQHTVTDPSPLSTQSLIHPSAHSHWSPLQHTGTGPPFSTQSLIPLQHTVTDLPPFSTQSLIPPKHLATDPPDPPFST